MGTDAPGEEAARNAIAGVDRDAQSRIIAALARRFGDLDLAEDMLHEAVVRALEGWPRTGVPDSPAAWLTTAATRRAIDIVRHDDMQARRLARISAEREMEPVSAAFRDPADAAPEENQLPDDRLGLFFACAHPALAPEDRLALTLRFVGGLSTSEVAHALLVPVPTMQQRITRAKRRIRTMGIRFIPPAVGRARDRLPVVRQVVYLIFAEGFAASTGSTHTRDDLAEEAIRLARILHQLTPGSAESTGLLALLLLTHARRPARADAHGHPVALADQDRSRWSRDLIREGLTLAARAAGSPGAGPFAIQSAIAAVHSEAPSFDATDWAQIAVLYRLLAAHDDGPVVRLGEAVAQGRAQGPREGLRRLDALASDPVLARFRPFHTARAVTLEELDEHAAAAEAYRRALELPGNEAEDAYLVSALDGLCT